MGFPPEGVGGEEKVNEAEEVGVKDPAPTPPPDEEVGHIVTLGVPVPSLPPPPPPMVVEEEGDSVEERDPRGGVGVKMEEREGLRVSPNDPVVKGVSVPTT